MNNVVPFSGTFQVFSLLDNTQSLFSTREESNKEISCLHGLKSITMAWIILIHVTLSFSYSALFNFEEFMKVIIKSYN